MPSENRGPISSEVERLSGDVARRLRDLENEDVSPSHVEGFASASVNDLEALLRQVMGRYASLCGITLSEDPLSLTYGQLVDRLGKLNKQLTAFARRSPEGQAALTNRRLLSGREMDHLKRISKLRKTIYHRLDSSAVDSVTLREYTKELLSKIGGLLQSPFFRLCSDE